MRSGRGRKAARLSRFVRSIGHKGFPGGHPVRATNDELRVNGLIGHNWNWITGLVDCQAGPDATDLWGRRQQMLAFLSRTLRTFSRCPPETAVVSCISGGFRFGL